MKLAIRAGRHLREKDSDVINDQLRSMNTPAPRQFHRFPKRRVFTALPVLDLLLAGCVLAIPENPGARDCPTICRHLLDHKQIVLP